jgi:hypothetical protein
LKNNIKKTTLPLALLVIVGVALLVTENISKNNRPEYISDNNRMQELNRAIASAQPMEIVKNIEWEHKLAQKLSNEEGRLPASISQRAGLLEQLRYGDLEGNYRFALVSGTDPRDSKIKEIEFVENIEMGTKPSLLRMEPEVFLQKYKEVFSVKYESVKINGPEKSNEKPAEKSQPRFAASEEFVQQSYELLESGQVVGTAIFKFDRNGYLLSVKIR